MFYLGKRGFTIVSVTVILWLAISALLMIFYTDCNDNTMDCISIKSSILQISRRNRINRKVQLSSEQLDFLRRQHFRSWSQVVVQSNPSDWPGEMGAGVEIPSKEEKLKNEKFKLNQFNILASDRIALNRTLTDVRSYKCKKKQYAKKLLTTSIVIVFHNEAWSTLLRTVHSVIRMSPRELVEEIILVDDASEREHLKKQLDEYVSKLDVPVKVIRTGQRSGLIQARLIGAAAVRGQVITFLDAHCECTIGWLEPLLDRVTEDRKKVVCPIIDVISDENFEHLPASDMTWGGFNWRMQFRWYRVSRREMDRRNHDHTEPIRTPAMAGGLFSIDKDYFDEIGKYDEEMVIWGGENIELSFRVWMCGGILEIVPCSHVGHVFRKTTPYTFPGGTGKIVNHNNARLAEVWLDEWKDFFYAISPGVKRFHTTDVTERKNLRKQLNCKSFKWYLENIYPESQMPIDYYYFGEIKNELINKCLDTYDRKSGKDVGVYECHGMGGNQLFVLTKRKQIMSNENCLEAGRFFESVKLERCHDGGRNQMWEYDKERNAIIHVNTGKCLDTPDQRHLTVLVLNNCDGRTSQKWIMDKKFKW